MAAVFCTAILPAKLNAVRVNFLQGLILHLYKNDKVPGPHDLVGTYVEADFAGYAQQAINDWGATFLNGADQGETDTGVHTFQATAAAPANTIYGYYLTTPAGELVAAERNPAGGFLIDAAGKTFSVKLMDVLD